MAEDFLIGVGKNNRNNEPEETPKQPQKPQEPQNDVDKPSKTGKYIKGCGIGCLTLFVIFLIIGYIGDTLIENYKNDDLRYVYLNQDIERLSGKVSEENVYSSLAKMCIDSSIYIEKEVKEVFKKDKKYKVDISQARMEYFTRRNNEKLLILLRMRNDEDMDAASRSVFIEALLECFSYVEDELEIEEYYISLVGKTNTLLVYTPNASDLDERRFDKDLLLPFYEEYVKDSLPSLE
jgi:hypothetical protein